MRNLNSRTLVVLTGFLLFLTSCQKEIIIKVDNPTSKTILFKIDDLNYKVKAHQQANYKVLSGKHNLIYNSDTLDIYLDKKKKYMLNPTQSTYVIESVRYGDEMYQKFKKILDERMQEKKKQDSLPESSTEIKDTLMIDIVEGVYLPFTLSSDTEKHNSALFVADWDYGVLEPLPETVNIQVMKNSIPGKSKTLKKIYRRQQYVTYIKKQSGF